MLDKLHELLQRMLDASQRLQNYNNIEAIMYLTFLEIEENYLMLTKTNANLKTVDVIMDSFSEEVNLYNDGKERKQKRIYLRDVFKSEIFSTNPDANNIIEKMSENAYLIRKDEGLNEYNEVMQVGIELANAKLPKKYNLKYISSSSSRYGEDNPYQVKRNAREGMKNLIDLLTEFESPSVYINNKGSVNITLKKDFFIDHDEIQTLLDVVAKEKDKKEAKRIMNVYRKYLRELVEQSMFNDTKYNYYGSNGYAVINIIDDWYDELVNSKHVAIPIGYFQHDPCKEYKFSIRSTAKEYMCNKIVFSPSITLSTEDFNKRLFSEIEKQFTN